MSLLRLTGQMELERVRRVVAEELRDQLATLAPALPIAPLPNDVDAERGLLGLALRGEYRPDAKELPGLEFFVPMHRDIWAAADVAYGKKSQGERMVTVALALEATEKYSPPSVVSELEYLADYVAPRSPWAMVQSVREKYRARRLCEWLHRINEDLRLGRIDVKRAMERLGKATR